MNTTLLVSVIVVTRVDFAVTAPAAKAPANADKPAAKPAAKAPAKIQAMTLVTSKGNRTPHTFDTPTLALIDSILGGHSLVMATNSGEAMFFVERDASRPANVFASVEGNRVIRGPVLTCSLEVAKEILARG